MVIADLQEDIDQPLLTVVPPSKSPQKFEPGKLSTPNIDDKAGENLKVILGESRIQKLVELSESNEEIDLDFSC